jgi:hypothetical protein
LESVVVGVGFGGSVSESKRTKTEVSEEDVADAVGGESFLSVN